MASKNKDKIIAHFHDDVVLTEATDLARELYNTYTYGTIYRKKRTQLYTLLIVIFLKEQMEIQIHMPL